MMMTDSLLQCKLIPYSHSCFVTCQIFGIVNCLHLTLPQKRQTCFDSLQVLHMKQRCLIYITKCPASDKKKERSSFLAYCYSSVEASHRLLSTIKRRKQVNSDSLVMKTIPFRICGLPAYMRVFISSTNLLLFGQLPGFYVSDVL